MLNFLKYYRRKNQNTSCVQIHNNLTNSLCLSAKNYMKSINYEKSIVNFNEIEFSVFSQFGDDGIIQYLIRNIEISNKIFVEFGVENYLESNTRFLLMNNNWDGLIIDSSKKNIDFIKHDYISWKYPLTSIDAFITKDNINELIQNSGFTGEIGLLSIDVDGNDYWIWEAIEVVNPTIVIVEYNSVFGKNRPITIQYNSKFKRNEAHYSMLFFGASLSALCMLADKKGYYFIGCNSNGVNAYFVKKNKIGNLKPITAQEGFIESKISQSRDKNNNLSHINYKKQFALIKGLNVVNIETKTIEQL